jgi:chromosome segregation ATPase
MPRWLARITGQDLRRDLTQVRTEQERISRTLALAGPLLAQIARHQRELLSRLTTMEILMSQLDSAVDDLLAAFGTAPADLQTALARIGELNTEIATLTANDQADADQIATLTAERDELVSDSQENVAKIRAVLPEPAPEPDPAPEPAPADPGFPVDDEA